MVNEGGALYVQMLVCVNFSAVEGSGVYQPDDCEVIEHGSLLFLQNVSMQVQDMLRLQSSTSLSAFILYTLHSAVGFKADHKPYLNPKSHVDTLLIMTVKRQAFKPVQADSDLFDRRGECMWTTG